MQNIYIYILAYILLLFIISYLVSRKQSSEDFFISGRNRSGWQILLSKYAAAIGAGWFITYTGFAYEYGLGVFALLIGMFLGYMFFAYWAAPIIQKNSKLENFYTLGDFVFHKTKNNLSKYSSNILSSIIQFSWLIVGIIGGAKIIEDFGFLSYPLAVIITSSVILVYILLAGYKAVILTDVFQSIIIFLLLIFITLNISGSETISALTQKHNTSFDITLTLGFLLFGALSVFSYSDRYQLCYAAKSKKRLTKALSFAVIPILLSAFLLLILGNFMSINSPGLDSALVFTESLKQFLPSALLPFAIVLFFAGIMSSADTGVYAIASHYALSKKSKSIKSLRKTIIILMIITTFIALIFSNIVEVSILAGGISLTLSFPMIYLLYKSNHKKSKVKFISSLLTSILGLILGLIIFGINPEIALTTVFFGALGLLKK